MAASTEVNNVDHRAPDVQRLVYSMYRKMLSGYNDQANEIVDSLPREIVQEDADIYRHLGEVL
ncbi:hypothetical protein RUM43_001060 [Polyplax serrata]|uniref:Uncharacterized protein n=1 Tax=Polyplax serrata TaxID=468196 RepID=A0AAN8XT85_POLSC